MAARVDEEHPPPAASLDLRGLPCPQNSARALLEIEMLDDGEVLELFLDDGESCERVPVTLEWEGHVVLSMVRTDGHWTMLVQRGED